MFNLGNQRHHSVPSKGLACIALELNGYPSQNQLISQYNVVLPTITYKRMQFYSQLF